MSINRYAAQRDTNEAEIRDAFATLYWATLQHTTYDLEALCPRCGRVEMVEVKTRKGRLTPSQAELVKDGWPLRIIRNTGDVVSLIEDHGMREHG